MRLYILRHTDAGQGEQMDSARGLTATGIAQAHEVADWLMQEIGRVDIVISSPFTRALHAAEIAAGKLGSYVATTTGLEPDKTPQQAWAEIDRLAQKSADVLVVGHGPMLRWLMAWLLSCDFPSMFRLPKGGCAYIVVDDVKVGELQWLVSRGLIERQAGQTEVAEAARNLVRTLERGEYYYEDVTLKRWNLGDGGKAGNCENCEENADAGWIEESEIFPAGEQPVDEPPLHPNDTCDVEYKDTRRRVYA